VPLPKQLAVHQYFPCRFVRSRKRQVYSEQLVRNWLVVDLQVVVDCVFAEEEVEREGGEVGKRVEAVVRWNHGCGRLLVIAREKGF